MFQTESEEQQVDQSTAAQPVDQSQALVVQEAHSLEEADRGRTTIADVVVAKIAGIIARETEGVYRLVGGGALSGLAQRVTGGDGAADAGVHVKVDEQEATISLRLITMYGTSIPQLAQTMRQAIITQVHRMTGLTVTQVDIEVVDLHFPNGTKEQKPALGEPESAEAEDYDPAQYKR